MRGGRGTGKALVGLFDRPQVRFRHNSSIWAFTLSRLHLSRSAFRASRRIPAKPPERAAHLAPVQNRIQSSVGAVVADWSSPVSRGRCRWGGVRPVADLGPCVNDSDHEPHDDPAPVVDPTCDGGKGSIHDCYRSSCRGSHCDRP